LNLIFNIYDLDLKNKKIRVLSRNEGDPEDPFDESYLIQTKRKYGDTAENTGQSTTDLNTSLNDQINDEELENCELNCNEKELVGDQLLGIDQLIVQCIDRCDSEEMKKRMFSCILIVGGGSKIHGIDNFIRDKLNTQIPLYYKCENIEVIVKPKDIQPDLVAWKGASVMSLLDSANELWFSKDEWNKLGPKLLRERAAFIW
jgi:actin-related protein 8